jgi:hypothetical protein
MLNAMRVFDISCVACRIHRSKPQRGRAQFIDERTLIVGSIERRFI